MFSNVYLAATMRELEEFLPKKAAFLSCHFSAAGQGLSNLPSDLPKKSLLLVDDSMPVCGHDPGVVVKQLQDLVEKFDLNAILLDFQGEKDTQLLHMAKAILQGVPCPVAVTEQYAKELGCPVFLSSSPVDTALHRHLSRWLEQGVFLEIAPGGMQIEVTQAGCKKVPISFGNTQFLSLFHEELCCHYHVEVFNDKAVFTLGRTNEDLAQLADKALALGALGVVGLYQELSK